MCNVNSEWTTSLKSKVMKDGKTQIDMEKAIEILISINITNGKKANEREREKFFT